MCATFFTPLSTDRYAGYSVYVMNTGCIYFYEGVISFHLGIHSKEGLLFAFKHIKQNFLLEAFPF